MKPILIILLILNLITISAQTFTYPILKSEGQTITDFIPPGWIIRDSASGDLNKDAINDVVLILQHKDSISMIKNEDGFIDTVITQPRILVILFRNNIAHNYKLMEQSNTFILNHDNPMMEDPYQSITIADGVLQINCYLFYNMGSWYVNNTSYKFRYQNNNFVLIGADNNVFARNSLDYEDFSYNFMTKQWSHTSGNYNEEKKEKTEWHTLNVKELPTFKTFIKPYSWEVTKDVYL